MPDAGDDSITPTSRRYDNDAVIECYRNLVEWARTADSLGYDTMWLTEHHFQYEGYEVLPNLILFGQHLASQTKQRPTRNRGATKEPLTSGGRILDLGEGPSTR